MLLPMLGKENDELCPEDYEDFLQVLHIRAISSRSEVSLSSHLLQALGKEGNM